jgi:AraC-like DNA-binding protein
VPAIKGRNREIPAGLVGEIRRTVAGARFDIDHRHTELEFDLVVRGSGSYTLDEESYILKPGTLVWLVPGQRHRLVRSPNLEMWVVTVRPDLFEVGHVRDLGMRPSSLLPGHELVDLDRLLSQVAQDSDEPAIYNAGVVYLTRRVIRASRDSPLAHRRPMHPAVARALLLLRQTGAMLSLPDLARESGVTPPYLSRLLIEHTARSFVTWRNRIRLERFMTGYRPGDNLMSAATSAGFGSYARFNHVFNDIIGCAPRDWIKRCADGSTAPGDASLSASRYGVPEAVTLSGRQRWTRLVPFVGSAAGIVLGQQFLAGLVSAARQANRSARKEFEQLNGTLPLGERKRLIASLRSKDPGIARDLSGLIDAVDFSDTYKGIAEFYGYSTSSLIDAVAAFVIVLWVAGSQGGDPGLDQADAVRQQVRGALAGALANLDARVAQDAHTAFIAAFVVTYQALQATRASGDPRAFHELREAACLCCREALGGDVTKIELRSSGFVPRQEARKARAPTSSLGRSKA